MFEGFSLTSLDLSFNKIFSLEAQIFVESLQEINLEGNKIASIAAGTFSDLPTLKSVNLQSNLLTTVTRNSLQIVRSVRGGDKNPVFLLSENPLLCDCTLQWTLTADTVADLTRVTCQQPDQSIAHVSQAARDTFLCHYETHCFSLCRCCTFLACDCRMNCPDMCTCLHDESWHVNIIQCGGRNLTKVPREIPVDASSVYLDNNNLNILAPEIFLGRSKLTKLFLNNSLITGLSNGTFLGLSALKELYLSHNQIEKLDAEHLTGLEQLSVLELDNNQLEWITAGLFVVLNKLKVLKLHSNHLVTLQMPSVAPTAVMELVTLQNNRWRCSSDDDCQWITLALDTFNKTAIADINAVTCQNGVKEYQKIVSFMSSCRNLDVLPVAAQTSSPSSVMIISSAITIVIIIIIIITIIKMFHPLSSHKHPVTTYLHYSMADDLYVRQQVGGQVTSVTSSVCYHHGDLSTQLSVGQAIASAVTRSGCLVIVATPGYITSAITGTELHILADCILHQFSYYPVVVLVSNIDKNVPSLYSLQQIKNHFIESVNSTCRDWVFISELDKLASTLDRLLVERQNNWFAKLLKVCKAKHIRSDTGGSNSSKECDEVDTRTISTMSSTLSPRSRTGVMESRGQRTLPPPSSNNTESFIGTKYGTGRLFQNPLVSRPDIVYHHHQEHTSEDDYETIEQ